MDSLMELYKNNKDIEVIINFKRDCNNYLFKNQTLHLVS